MLKKVFLLSSFAGVFFGALGGGLVAALIFHGTEPLSNPSSELNFDGTSYASVIEEAAPAVVSIVALKDLSEYYNQNLFGPFPFSEPTEPDQNEEPELSQVSSGTGFVVSPEGLVVTNKHVVLDEEAEYVVILDDGTELEAQVLDKDSLNDIALVQIVGEDERLGDLPHLNFADSDALQVGDPVLAIGNALGEYSNTTTLGIISARDRQIVASGAGFGSENLVNLIQTDAAINPGNSGGPLLNLAGEVVGMNTAIDSTASGIGFAIPSNDIAVVLKSYQEHGEILRPFFGVRYVPVTPGLQEHFSLGVEHGAYVIGDPESGPGVVEDSPADEAGIQEGDVLLSVNGKALTEYFSLQNAIAGYSINDLIQVEVWRKGESLSLQVRLAKSEL
ncbi:trypsin-like peptidase domain-containing protein [Candidatus Peregrinibacteria bacterium]|nr:MAG: trypsin-like peptidase domain-containing protein [Candidatus Peregrinibacteria bacterium]